MYNSEFVEENSEKNMSMNEKKFLAIMESSVKIERNHYVLPLPFKKKEVNMPNNRVQAEKRCISIKRKMLRLH